jgi:hypothetical protein
MNAKITISVDMEAVPQEVNNILLKIYNELGILRSKTEDVIDEKSELQKIVLIEEIRKQLSLLDAKCEDCYTVLVGYSKVTLDRHVASKAETKSQDNDNIKNG